MTEKQATAIAKKALPCPFCGEWVVVHDDHHGMYVAHKDEIGSCIASTIQLLDKYDLQQWNTRDGVQRIRPKGGLKAVFGKWPGDETDEQIQKALKELG